MGLTRLAGGSSYEEQYHDLKVEEIVNFVHNDAQCSNTTTVLPHIPE